MDNNPFESVKPSDSINPYERRVTEFQSALYSLNHELQRGIIGYGQYARRMHELTTELHYDPIINLGNHQARAISLATGVPEADVHRVIDEYFDKHYQLNATKDDDGNIVILTEHHQGYTVGLYKGEDGEPELGFYPTGG
jgi:hypothetical protein